MSIRDKLIRNSAFLPPELELGTKQLPLTDFQYLKEAALLKEDSRIAGSLGRQILNYFYSGEAAQVFLQYSNDAGLKKDLKLLRRAINDLVLRLTGVPITRQLEDFCHQAKKYQNQKVERQKGEHICRICTRKCKDRTHRSRHEASCKNVPKRLPLASKQDTRMRRGATVKLELTRNEKLENKIVKGYQAGLEIRMVAEKARSIFTLRKFKAGEYVCVYSGEVITAELAKAREQMYKDTGSGNFLYFFHFEGKQFCVDATAETSNFGRLINHSRNKKKINTVARVRVINTKPYVVFFAQQDIHRCSELLYDYGERRSKVLKDMPWLLK